jgi:methylenetetrahydrofolate dehydrogenase (NADP+) / methenyltetrahydrofolate cyclohydrolase
MTASLLDGKIVSAHYRHQLLQQLQQYKINRPPGLAVILVGEDPASTIYVNHKRKACESVGYYSEAYFLPKHTSEKELLDLIETLNTSEAIDGILVQLPLPSHIEKQRVIEHIHPAKDVDGFHPYNFGRLAQGHPTLRPCTPYGIIKLLEYYDLEISGKNAVIIGSSTIVGRPMAFELLLAKATPTVCHRATPSLKSHVENADILIVATGQQNVIQTSWLKPHQIVIDVGIHRLNDGTLRGDVDFKAAQKIVEWITPVPFGVGPMTICMLLHNTAQAYYSRTTKY